MRSVLVVSQVAMCVILLAMAGLLLRSLRAAQTVDLGFDPQQIALASFELGNQAYSESRGRAFYDAIVRETEALPGVQAVSLAQSTPLGLDYSRRGVSVEGYQPKPGEDLEFGINIVGPRYFDVMRIPMVRGREFAEQDRAGSLPVAIVNESFARYFWPGDDPIGKRIGTGDQMRVVVGVARDSKTRSVSEEPSPYFYLPYLQSYGSNMILEVRTAGDPRAIIPIVRREAATLDPDLPVQTETMEDAMGVSLLPQRAGATLLGIFSLLGLALAAIGLYGVMAYAVSQRTRELGIRMALGAQTRDIYRVVLGRGLSLMAIGLLVGIALSMLLTRLVRGLLFGVSPVDPLTFGSVAVVLTIAALVASYVPARRATRVDPLVALREE
jgi:predicted permease